MSSSSIRRLMVRATTGGVGALFAFTVLLVAQSACPSSVSGTATYSDGTTEAVSGTYVGHSVNETTSTVGGTLILGPAILEPAIETTTTYNVGTYNLGDGLYVSINCSTYETTKVFAGA